MPDQADLGTTVLVVEDDFILLGIITSLFERAGLSVRSASSGEAALTILRDRASTIDWLFTDVNLPGFIDGWVVAAEYRLCHPFRPIIYASTEANHPRWCVNGSLFVAKPFDPREILNLAGMMRGELDAHFGAAEAAAYLRGDEGIGSTAS